MKAIAAVDLNWGIGYKGGLLQWIPEDMKFFKKMTSGKVVVMGRQTFESLPGKEPLKDRINIVLSKNEYFNSEKVRICRSLDELLLELGNYDSEDIFIIGGESVYTQLLPLCTEAYITRIKKIYMADKNFINLDEDEAWKMVSQSSIQTFKNIEYQFTKYENTKINKEFLHKV